MNEQELLLQEIKQEAKNAKGIIYNEVESFVEELSNISLSDFSPPFFTPHKYAVEKCFRSLKDGFVLSTQIL